MLQSPAANQNGMNIEVTTTSTGLFDLINTAQGTSGTFANYSSAEDGINLTIEGDDIRVGYSLDPTPTLGRPMYKGNTYYIRGTTLQYLKLISTTANNSKVSIELGCAEPGEVGSSSPAGHETVSDTPTHASVTMTTADTEYTYTLTETIKGFEMRLVNDSDGQCTNDFKLCYGGSSGDSATSYIPVEDGELYWRGTMKLPAGFVLRFQSPTAGQTMKIVTYS